MAMISPILLALVCAPQPCGSPPLASPISSFEDDERPDRVPAIKELVDLLGEHASKRGEADSEAVRLMEELSLEYPNCGPKDRASIATAIGKCLAVSRKDLAEDQPDNSLYLPAATHLGKMREEATKILVKWIEHKKHRYNLVLKRELIRSLGKTKDTAGIECLTDLLQYSDANVIAWSAEALAEFKELPAAKRKEIFSDVLRVLVTTSEQKDDVTNVEAGRRWETIKNPMFRTLGDLSGQQFRKAEEWQRWWNENKREEWGEPTKQSD